MNSVVIGEDLHSTLLEIINKSSAKRREKRIHDLFERTGVLDLYSVSPTFYVQLFQQSVFAPKNLNANCKYRKGLLEYRKAACKILMKPFSSCGTSST